MRSCKGQETTHSSPTQMPNKATLHLWRTIWACSIQPMATRTKWALGRVYKCWQTFSAKTRTMSMWPTGSWRCPMSNFNLSTLHQTECMEPLRTARPTPKTIGLCQVNLRCSMFYCNTLSVIVGSVLGGLVIVVVIAYIIGRRKSSSGSSYDNMNHSE